MALGWPARLHNIVDVVLRLRSTTREASGVVNVSFWISKTVTDIYLKQVIVEEHMKEVYYFTTKKLLFKKAQRIRTTN